ncbi:MAG: PaaI family thioesterase [bacterium]|nr:PaaI family thioesterase [bacterium]
MADEGARSVQERFAPRGTCFGCGPANPKGLRIRSLPIADEPDALVCDWTPESHHAAYETFLNGGVIGSIFDCHANWAATWHLMRRDGLDTPPCTVTAELGVRFRRPTPMDAPVRLEARTVSSNGSRVEVEATLTTGGEVTAICTGTFVAVEPGHPAYHRW